MQDEPMMGVLHPSRGNGFFQSYFGLFGGGSVAKPDAIGNALYVGINDHGMMSEDAVEPDIGGLMIQ